MQQKKNIFITFLVFIVIASLYRLMPGRPLGFAPQIAIALFAGATIRNKKFAFTLPLISMLIGDLVFELLYRNGLSEFGGFYNGQLLNYILFAGITAFGFLINTSKKAQILAGTIAAPTAYFLISNFAVWISGGGFNRPKTFEGLMTAYVDGIPFYQGSLMATLLFSAIFFGTYLLSKKNSAVSMG
ncbi:MAG: DUF6580 family putative transport protein [Bacteroidota bacterium]|jgi:hypothetical protein